MAVMDWIASPSAWVALVTLVVLEIVLGIDNIAFISILSGRLPERQRPLARRLGLLGAMVERIALLFAITWLSSLTRPLFSVLGLELAGQNLVYLAGGMFLLYKSTVEIHGRLEGDEETGGGGRPPPRLLWVVAEIMLLDIVFSLDSVITAVGMADHVAVMVIAVVIAVGIMMFAVEPVSRFIDAHPTVKMLALSFLLLIGLLLVADGLGQHIPKGYVYFAMGFSMFVELLNLRAAGRRRAAREAERRGPYAVEPAEDAEG